MSEPTLGDILAEALTRDEPRPPNPVEQVIADTIASISRQWEAAAQQVAERAMVRAGETLADALAPLVGSTAEEVFNSLGHLPDAMLRHLASPQGWSILAGHVAADLGVRAPDYAPTVH